MKRPAYSTVALLAAIAAASVPTSLAAQDIQIDDMPPAVGVSEAETAQHAAATHPDTPPPAPFIEYDTKLLLTNAITAIDGASGGGISNWATIAGREETRGIGVQMHTTAIFLPDYRWHSFGGAVGIANRVELSYARQNFDTRDVGGALGIGQGYMLNQDVFGLKVRVLGDVVYGETLVPQVSVGVQYKRSLDGAIASAVGAAHDEGVDFTFSATKLLLSHSLLVNAGARLTKANQNGLLGFGSVAGDSYSLQFEGALAYQFSRRLVVGTEFRSKPDNLGLGEDDWLDIFAAYAPSDHITLTAAYADLGSIATFGGQRGAFLQAQVAF